MKGVKTQRQTSLPCYTNESKESEQMSPTQTDFEVGLVSRQPLIINKQFKNDRMN